MTGLQFVPTFEQCPSSRAKRKTYARTDFSIVILSSRRTRRVRVLITSSIASWLCAVPLFVPGGRSFVPACGCRGAPRAGTVKAGRRACLDSRASVARPHLDGPEHGARIKRVGTLLHWS